MQSGIINVPKGFQTAVNIAFDLNDDDKVRGFIPTQSALDIIEDVLLSTATTATIRSRILIGAYGRGKSHIILVLLSLLAGRDSDLFVALFDKMGKSNPLLCEFAREYLNSGRKLLPIVVRGSSTSLSASFLNALQLALSDEGLSNVMPETHFQAAIATIDTWKNSYPQTYESFVDELPCSISDYMLSLHEYDTTAYEQFESIYPKLTAGSTFNPFLGFDIVELYESVTKSIKAHGYNGLIVVYDEFSKYLESSIANATISDIKLIQDFAEKCDRSGEWQMHLLLICHKDIANYIDGGLPKEKVDGWRGISGRFKHINLHNNYTQMYEIISEVIKKEQKTWQKFKKSNKTHFDDLAKRFTANRLLDTNNAEEIEYAIYGCYPLHPISTFILPRISEKVAQNERTLFTFLSSEDRHTLSAFLGISSKKFALLTPDYIYDYFEPLLRKEPYNSETHKIYKLTTNALQKVEEDSIGAKILKTVALVYLVEQFEKLPPIVDMIVEAFRDTVGDVKLINDALIELIEHDCIIYLKRSNDYLKLKESSGVDIPATISNYVECNRKAMRVSDILNRSAYNGYMYPTRYNEVNEITRYFEFVFMDSADFWNVSNWEHFVTDTGADGVICALIPKNKSEISNLRSAVKEGLYSAERVLFIIPSSHSDIGKIAFEYEAVKNLRVAISDDDLLADEYDIYIEDLNEVITEYVNRYALPENKGATYYYSGQKCAVYRRSQLSEKLSEICEKIYYKTPVINNETINKNLLSWQTLNSRRRLLAGLLAKELAPNLGLIGTGQEVSIMRSVLVQTGILTNVDTLPIINLEPVDERIRAVLSVIRNFFLGANKTEGRLFSELYRELVAPEHGIGLKRGLIPIFIAVVLCASRQNFIVKQGNNEVGITPDLLGSINEHPDDYSITLENWSEDKAAYLAGLEKVFEEYIIEREKVRNSFAFILLAMNRWYMNLPKYAKELDKLYIGSEEFETLDERRKKFINSLKQPDSNPREYLLEKVFSMLGKQEYLDGVTPLIAEIKEAWDAAVPNLIKKLAKDVKEIFATKKIRGSLASIICDWYEPLSKKAKQHIFAGNQRNILDLMATPPNDEAALVQRLAKAVTSLRIEDWNSDTIIVFLSDLREFKETVEAYNSAKQQMPMNESNEYIITFMDNDGKPVTKTFGRIECNGKAKILLNCIKTELEEHGQAITEQEKRQVLMELLQNFC
jgi:hypothetical protein